MADSSSEMRLSRAEERGVSVFERGGYQALPLPAGYTSSDARGVSGDGTIVAGKREQHGRLHEGVRWTPAGAQFIGCRTRTTWGAGSRGSVGMGRRASESRGLHGKYQ